MYSNIRNQITKCMVEFYFPIDSVLNVVDKFNHKRSLESI